MGQILQCRLPELSLLDFLELTNSMLLLQANDLIRIKVIVYGNNAPCHIPDIITKHTTLKLTTVKMLLINDDSLAPNAKAIENNNVTPSEKKSGNFAMLSTSIGICSKKKFDIALSTNASRYVKSPFTTLAEPIKYNL